MPSTWRRIPTAAYLSLAVSLVGVAAELTFHFLPPDSIPAYGRWLAGLSAVDRDFYNLAYELIAHFFIGLGLTGIIAVFLHRQIAKSDQKADDRSAGPK